MADHLLDITPSKLVFPCELFKELYRTLALHNPNADSRIAFKCVGVRGRLKVLLIYPREGAYLTFRGKPQV